MTDNKDPQAITGRRLLNCIVRSFLIVRWYDSQRKEWTDWEEITGRELTSKYGDTPEQWKEACKSWIEIGGFYDYRIGTETKVIEWETSYLPNAQGHQSPTKKDCQNEN